MAVVIDPITGALIDKKTLEQKENQDKKQKQNYEDINKLDYGETTLVPDAEEDNEVSGATAFVAGIASGLIKVPEGVVSLGAELIDLGAGTNTAASVEEFFDDINPFEEIAENEEKR